VAYEGRRREPAPIPVWRRARRVVLVALAICLVPAAISWLHAIGRPRNIGLGIATEMFRPATRYLTPDERDFFAVYTKAAATGGSGGGE
jgi:hypothetical protein